MRLHNVALPLALSCVLVGGLTACSSDGSDATDSASPVTVTQTVKKPKPAESKEKAKPKPTRKAQESEPSKKTRPKRCGDLSAEEALRQNVGKVPEFKPGWTWNTEYAGTGLYDPCADLSPIVLTIDMATASSPYHIMLFHKGEYLGTATAEPQGFSPAVKQVDDQTIAVTYFYTKPGEANAMRSGEAHATFTWDPAQEKVIMDGNLPPRG
ncbi:LppP/LprE family lipoprotein [Corynebacterium sp. UMB9976]|uniref:LppP/LprE family lipoprotein n=1 Tax=Corynebacterium sp. UMB9976 TaxID=3046354 RepID=UPI00254C64B0|nr:LppP/LprE family lipoprotein [Corynebacterium sp. UMB9976]MDK6302037.1 LppP/LprE family lipoprotein [Corynebacterium sp. UMB9976]